MHSRTAFAPGLVIGDNAQALTIGAQADGQYQYRGAIDELYIHDYALDATAIAALALVPPPAPDSDGDGVPLLS